MRGCGDRYRHHACGLPVMAVRSASAALPIGLPITLALWVAILALIF